MDALETLASQWVAEHPEYHAELADVAATTARANAARAGIDAARDVGHMGKALAFQIASHTHAARAVVAKASHRPTCACGSRSRPGASASTR